MTFRYNDDAIARAEHANAPATDGRAEGLREAGIESQDYVRGWNDAMMAQGLEVIDPPAWQPPPESERQDCFTCLGWHPHGEWQAVMWIKYMAAWWWVFDDAKASPTHFLPMPPAPAQEGEP